MKENDFEKIIIKSLISNEKVRDKVLPFLKEDWFGYDIENKIIVKKILDYNTKSGKMPNMIELRTMIHESSTNKALDEIAIINNDDISTDYMIEEIQEFVKKKMINNIADKMHEYCCGRETTDSFTDDIATAEAFSFDNNIGLSFFEEPDVLFDDIIANERIFSTGLKSIDDLLGGGLHEKSLTLFMAPTNVGKTLILCSLTTNLILQNKNVLYVTFEDSEKKIAQRIAQNLYDVTQIQLKGMTKSSYNNCFNKSLAKIGHNRLVIKEYSEQSLNAIGLKALIKELKEKKGFIPYAIMIDYIGCMIPNGRISVNTNDNTKLQLISGQVRSIGMELGIPIVSAMQTNRGGYQSSDLGLDDAADSFGQTMKADAILGVMVPPNLDGMYILKLLKTRFGNKRFQTVTIGVDVEKQRIYDVEDKSRNSSPEDIIKNKSKNSINGVLNNYD